jgi:hypothetical protein
MMPFVCILGMLVFALAAGCAGFAEAPPGAAARTGSQAGDPVLNVAALKTRLRDTPAIGMFTKLALRNQVDDLLDRFRAYHRGGQKAGVVSLREQYELLVLKVLAVLQDIDSGLARAIAASHEAIWGILLDPDKFNDAT